MRIILGIGALLAAAPFLGCMQSEYLRGYTAGMERADSFCRKSQHIDELECRMDLTDEKAKLKICEGTLDMYKAGSHK